MNGESEKRLIENMRNEIKGYIRMKGFTYEHLAQVISQEYNIPTSPQSINNKLSRGSIKYVDVLRIASALGYTIKWI